MNEDKGFSLLLKIVIVAMLLGLVLVTGFIYSRNLDKELVGRKQDKPDEIQSEKVIVDYDELVENYENDLIRVINAFDGDYQYLQEQIIEIAVPSGFQELHLQLVLALNHVLYEGNINITKEKLQDIADNNNWLANSLNKVIVNIE